MRCFAIPSSTLVTLLVAASSGSLGAQSPKPLPAGGDLCTGGQASGTGLRGAYYSAVPAAGSPPPRVRVDARIGSAALRKPPAPLAAGSVRTVRWCGWIRPIASGAHRLQSAASGMRIELANQPVAGPRVPSGTSVHLEAGKSYSILIELPDAASAGEFSLQWTPPFGATYDVPPTVLFPPVETVEPGC